MIPIHNLLNRIRWDKEFGRGQFEIGYYDRHKDAIERVALGAVTFSESGSFELIDELGTPHQIPLHRIREVYRDGRRIWHRPGQAGGEGE